MASCAVAAEAAGTSEHCGEEAFADPALLRLGRVAAAGLYLQLGGNGCPGAAASCRIGGALTRGQKLLLAAPQAGYVCAAAALGPEVATGWLAERAIAAATSPVDPAPPLAAWSGTWRYFDNRVVLSRAGDAISASGEAYWPARNVMPANEGGFAGAASPSGARLHIGATDPVDCAVEMVLAGPFLVVTDNRNCGGHNVSFRGIYVRRARAR